ncbi:hypothetical protein EDB86DRAFT_170466 [Lactarius hatsudake]|nr:hypothetical protein EDB86DRAFT_170466 [Lactarius hatsudake]
MFPLPPLEPSRIARTLASPCLWMFLSFPALCIIIDLHPLYPRFVGRLLQIIKQSCAFKCPPKLANGSSDPPLWIPHVVLNPGCNTAVARWDPHRVPPNLQPLHLRGWKILSRKAYGPQTQCIDDQLRTCHRKARVETDD